MKNTIIAILSVLTISFGFSQEKIADFGKDSQTYSENRTKGVYIFHLNSDEYSEEKVAKAASFYKDFFHVTSKKDGEKIKVQITLKGISQENKKVVARFFVGLEVKEITYKDEHFKPMDFLSKYI